VGKTKLPFAFCLLPFAVCLLIFCDKLKKQGYSLSTADDFRDIYMQFVDFLALIHPVLAIVVVFPIIGLVVNFAWQTRQRRLETNAGNKSKIPPVARARTSTLRPLG
jgi:heme/copper-type cytochrome/quinol oxidase subunit 2